MMSRDQVTKGEQKKKMSHQTSEMDDLKKMLQECGESSIIAF